ncbi:MAG: hypothetical protein JKY37_34490 [Nannocystaceae bacterium]|nr:hypothetical protein [Nannocystaceae bacterium]
MLLRAGLSLACVAALSLSAACGGDKKPTMAEALAKSDQVEADRKAAEEEKKAAVVKAPTLAEDPSKVEYPWDIYKLKDSLKMGLVISYGVTGTDAKGKEVTDEYRGEVKGNNEHDVAVIQTLVSLADTPQAKQTLSLPWDKASPFFYVERASTEVTGRETIETPAGKFDCITADLKGFFGAHKTVWMPIGKPGIYAKVVDHGNANAEDDQTEITYTLATISAPPS